MLKMIGVGNRGAVEAILIDARPQVKYQRGTIPSSLNIADTDFEEGYKQIADISKDKEIIVFCGGYACTKSAIVADLLIKKKVIRMLKRFIMLVSLNGLKRLFRS